VVDIQRLLFSRYVAVLREKLNIEIFAKILQIYGKIVPELYCIRKISGPGSGTFLGPLGGGWDDKEVTVDFFVSVPSVGIVPIDTPDSK
jgi:hypothetical protein